MKKLLFTFSALFLLLIAACSKPQPRTIENPSIAATNCSNLNLTKVELNDSATVLSFHVKYRPGWWIQIAEGSKLIADGKEYPVISSENLVIGKHFTMPESGEEDFSLTFAPIPLDSKSIDFTEGIPDGWVFYGIDVTGKPKDTEDHIAELPKDISNIDITDINAEPVFEAAPSELRFHMLGYRPEYGNKINLILDNPAYMEISSVKLDDKGEGSVTMPLYGTTRVTMMPDDLNAMPAYVFVAPGETTDIYISPAIFSDITEIKRDKDAELHTPYAYTNGRYSAFNKANAELQKIKTEPAELDWHMNGEEYTAAQLAALEKETAAYNASDLPQAMKDYAIRAAKIRTLESLADARRVLYNKYYLEVGEEGVRDSVKIEMTPKEYAAATSLIDGNDDAYLILPELKYIFGQADWTEAGAKGKLFTEMPVYRETYAKAKAGRLTDSDISALKALSKPFYAQAVQLRNDEAKKDMEEAMKSVTKNPDVDNDKLFDAIVEKHKGKVVLVDLWNTWCGPCRNALKANEPLKSGELADDDIVWIYIADESSDLNQYVEMIKEIKGEHHIVNSDQIAAIRKRFGVDGIPYYILVDRNGKAEGHPDFRNHETLVAGIKAAL